MGTKNLSPNIYYVKYLDFLNSSQSSGKDNLYYETISAFCEKYHTSDNGLICIEDRGILICFDLLHRKIKVYVLKSLDNLATVDKGDVTLSRVNIYNNAHKVTSTPILKKLNSFVLQEVSKVNVEDIVERFMHYSNHLYRNPFDLNSKKIIFFNKHVNILKEGQYDYTTLYAAVKDKGYYGVSKIFGKRGMYYLDEGRLIKACPDYFTYLGDCYCVAKYYLCLPTENNDITYQLISVDELTTILNTIDLFKKDDELKDAYYATEACDSNFAFADNNMLIRYYISDTNDFDQIDKYMFKTSLSSLDDRVFFLSTKYTPFLEFIEPVYISDITTDFILKTSLFCQNDGDIRIGISSNIMFNEQYMNDASIWGLIDRMSSISETQNISKMYTPFSKECKIIVAEDLVQSKVVDLLYDSYRVDTIVYDRIKDIAYNLSFVSNEVVLISTKYTEVKGESKYEVATTFLKETELSSKYKYMINTGNPCILVSVSLINYLRQMCRESVNSFEG